MIFLLLLLYHKFGQPFRKFYTGREASEEKIIAYEVFRKCLTKQNAAPHLAIPTIKIQINNKILLKNTITQFYLCKLWYFFLFRYFEALSFLQPVWEKTSRIPFGNFSGFVAETNHKTSCRSFPILWPKKFTNSVKVPLNRQKTEDNNVHADLCFTV